MGYTQDYQLYMSGTECPTSFVLWSSLALAGAVSGRKIWTSHGQHFTTFPNLYVGLVGTPGSGKSVAKDVARDLLMETWAEYPLSAEIQSHQNICRAMASPDGCFTYTDSAGIVDTYRPFFAMPDELQLFLSTDKAGMMGFLVGVHSSKTFATGFQNASREGLPQHIIHPYFSLLSCAVPDWFMSNLKIDLFSGGAGRRFVIVHDKKTKLIPRPDYMPGAVEARNRILNHLRVLKDLQGYVPMDPAAFRWWDEWYLSRDTWPNRDDPIILQFHETKHIITLKVALILAMNELEDGMLPPYVREEHLSCAEQMLSKLESSVIRLTSGIGRNVLAGLAVELKEKLLIQGGQGSEKKFRITFFRNMNDREWSELIQHLTSTDQLFVIGFPDEFGVLRNALFLPEVYESIFRHVCSSCHRRYHKPTKCCGKDTTLDPRLVPLTLSSSPAPGSGPA